MRYALTKRVESNKEFGLKILFFIFFPFFCFLYSLRTPDSKSSKVIFCCFGLLFAWIMDYHQSGLDFSRIVQGFYSQSLSTEDIKDEILLFFSGLSSYKELYRLILNWFTRLFSDNYHTLFLFASIPYLYFMMKSMDYILTDTKRFKRNIYCIVLLLLFIAPFDIFYISNYRFCTATWIYVYSIIQIYINNDRRYIGLLLLIPFIHSAFYLINLITLIGFVVPHKYYQKIFWISIPFAFVETDLINMKALSFLPDSLSYWVSNYLSEDGKNDFGMYAQGSGFYLVGIFLKKLQIVVYLIGVNILIKQNLNVHPDTKKIYYFIIFIFSMSNFCQVLPAFGGRFFGISKILFALVWFKALYNNPKKNYLYIILLGSTYMLLYYNLKQYITVLDTDFLWMNTLSLIEKSWNVTSYWYN